ncbi:MAG: CsgE family curli-type amyloid fiber assembly protein [Lutibacter sp.]
MRSFSSFLGIVVFFIQIQVGYTQQGIRAKILAKSVDNFVDIRAIAINNDITFKDEYTYLLFALKQGAKGNYSKNTQSGTFSLEANEQKLLSSLKVNIQNTQEIKVFLFIRKDGKLVTKDSALFKSAENTKKKVATEEDFSIKGIVIDNAITKIGKDFYDYFYQAYLVSGTKYGFIIKINERPYFGRSSIITVKVKDFTIYEFFSRPNEDYLKERVKITLQRLSLFNKQQKLLYNSHKI